MILIVGEFLGEELFILCWITIRLVIICDVGVMICGG
jgi:hypothetical protein